MCHWPKCEHMEGSTDISFQTQFLQFVWISSNKIHSRINVFPHLSSKFFEIIFLNLTLQRFSNNTKNTPKFWYNFQFSFHLSLPTLTHQKLFEDTKSMTWSIGLFGRLQWDKIKQGVCHTMALPFTLKISEGKRRLL